ncbi:MAG: NAD(P)-dependent oxidoreductase [Candidatus Dormiibacterota bacterium]
MYLEELRQLDANPAAVGIVGAGRMGRGVVDQIATMRGLRVRAVADLDAERGIAAFTANGWGREQVCLADQVGAAQDALAAGRPVVTEDPLLLADLDLAALVEATGVPAVGAEVADRAIARHRHVIMLNVEADCVVGPILAERARRQGVVYTLAAGDQPGVILELAEWARTLGFRLVCAGRGTVRFPDDNHATPETYLEMAEDNTLNPRMLCSFRDGTKAQTESAAVSNVLRMPPTRLGMIEPRVGWPELGHTFSLQSEGGILDEEGVVDMVNAVTPEGDYVHQDKVFPGVFLVVTSDHAGVQSAMRWHLDPGFGGVGRQEGPNWGLFRPYHLPCVETPMSVARAIVQGRPTGDLRGGPVAEVVTAAKRDLRPGDELDGAGGYAVYGLSERHQVARERNLFPLGFAYSGRVTRAVPRDQLLTWDDVEVDTSGFLGQLVREQDRLFG